MPPAAESSAMSSAEAKKVLSQKTSETYRQRMRAKGPDFDRLAREGAKRRRDANKHEKEQARRAAEAQAAEAVAAEALAAVATTQPAAAASSTLGIVRAIVVAPPPPPTSGTTAPPPPAETLRPAPVASASSAAAASAASAATAATAACAHPDALELPGAAQQPAVVPGLLVPDGIGIVYFADTAGRFCRSAELLADACGGATVACAGTNGRAGWRSALQMVATANVSALFVLAHGHAGALAAGQGATVLAKDVAADLVAHAPHVRDVVFISCSADALASKVHGFVAAELLKKTNHRRYLGVVGIGGGFLLGAGNLVGVVQQLQKELDEGVFDSSAENRKWLTPEQLANPALSDEDKASHARDIERAKQRIEKNVSAVSAAVIVVAYVMCCQTGRVAGLHNVLAQLHVPVESKEGPVASCGSHTGDPFGEWHLSGEEALEELQPLLQDMLEEYPGCIVCPSRAPPPPPPVEIVLPDGMRTTRYQVSRAEAEQSQRGATVSR